MARGRVLSQLQTGFDVFLASNSHLFPAAAIHIVVVAILRNFGSFAIINGTLMYFPFPKKYSFFGTQITAN